MHAQNQIKRTLSEPESVARVQALIRAVPDAHRTAVADRVCAAFGFVDPIGRAQRAGCLKALRALERAGRLTLPPPRTVTRSGGARRLDQAVPPPQAGRGSGLRSCIIQCHAAASGE